MRREPGANDPQAGAAPGVKGPSLYNHVASRDDLLDEMTALIAEQVDNTRG